MKIEIMTDDNDSQEQTQESNGQKDDIIPSNHPMRTNPYILKVQQLIYDAINFPTHESARDPPVIFIYKGDKSKEIDRDYITGDDNGPPELEDVPYQTKDVTQYKVITQNKADIEPREPAEKRSLSDLSLSDLCMLKEIMDDNPFTPYFVRDSINELIEQHGGMKNIRAAMKLKRVDAQFLFNNFRESTDENKQF